MRSGDSRLRTTTTKSGLETTFIVSGSVVLWTSTSELRKYRGSHSLKCRVGILAFKRRQQSGVLDRPLQLLVQLCFGLRRVNLENIAVPTRINTDEQLIQIYNSFFDFRLKCRVGILAFKRRQQSGVLDRPLQLLVQLCFGLRRVNLENIAVPTRINTDEQLIQIYNSLFDFRLKCEVGIVGFERRQQSRALKQHL
ncbi:uncharacterized protein V1477_016223 [Vespula maculifrons]|uniref:Uncharacterized protein n=1 Tax=Vespula maculifrons TaxID=7453 RepID=A0ABD2BCF3_VESMC